MDNKGLFKLFKLDNLIEHLSGYVEDKIALAKIEIKEELAVVAAKAIITIIMTLFLLFALLFASIVLGIYLSAVLGSYVFGFGAVCIFYILLFILLSFFKNHPKFNAWIEKKVNKPTSDKV